MINTLLNETDSVIVLPPHLLFASILLFQIQHLHKTYRHLRSHITQQHPNL